MAAQEHRDTALSSIRDEELVDLLGRRLPDLLRRRPDLEPTIFRAFLTTFARQEAVAVVMAELRALRTEMVQRFEQVDQRLDRNEQSTQEFRSEVTDQFKKVDEQFQGVSGHFKRVDEQFQGVTGHFKRVDEQFQGVTGHFKRVDEQFQGVTGHFKRVDEQFQGVSDQFKRVDDRFDGVHRSIDRLGSRWGIRNESLFRQTIAAVLEKSFGVRVTQRVIRGEQFDVLIYDHQHVLVEIAASVGRTIQQRLERKRNLYEEATGVRPSRVILATTAIHTQRANALRQAGFEVIEPEEDDTP